MRIQFYRPLVGFDRLIRPAEFSVDVPQPVVGVWVLWFQLDRPLEGFNGLIPPAEFTVDIPQPVVGVF